ncbi:hypothetical protein BDV24DRAFT_130789 [Aspergillus arachidicola]|uniref:Uncharacterized protein n=1 Tax=Aspergillus arachidicola TaxID=656916 RepID=A0A5N6YA60_9EURO|nr:hypothetical protein BDV24DRAFT_130789 [Aspergillus arachidicola]
MITYRTRLSLIQRQISHIIRTSQRTRNESGAAIGRTPRVIVSIYSQHLHQLHNTPQISIEMHRV